MHIILGRKKYATPNELISINADEATKSTNLLQHIKIELFFPILPNFTPKLSINQSTNLFLLI
jgi:hypothetical protein